MVTDPIADLITRILNAGRVGKPVVAMPYSKFKHSIADKLKKEGFVESVKESGKDVKKFLELTLLYKDGEHKIRGIERVSKPGRRLYCKSQDLKPIMQGFGSLFVSTPTGILTDKEARKNKVGGEVLLKIW